MIGGQHVNEHMHRLREQIQSDLIHGLVQQAMDAIMPTIQERVCHIIHEMEPHLEGYHDQMSRKDILNVIFKVKS